MTKKTSKLDFSNLSKTVRNYYGCEWREMHSCPVTNFTLVFSRHLFLARGKEIILLILIYF